MIKARIEATARFQGGSLCARRRHAWFAAMLLECFAVPALGGHKPSASLRRPESCAPAAADKTIYVDLSNEGLRANLGWGASDSPTEDPRALLGGTLSAAQWTIRDRCFNPSNVTDADSVRVVLLQPEQGVSYTMRKLGHEETAAQDAEGPEVKKPDSPEAPDPFSDVKEHLNAQADLENQLKAELKRADDALTLVGRKPEADRVYHAAEKLLREEGLDESAVRELAAAAQSGVLDKAVNAALSYARTSSENEKERKQSCNRVQEHYARTWAALNATPGQRDEALAFITHWSERVIQLSFTYRTVDELLDGLERGNLEWDEKIEARQDVARAIHLAEDAYDDELDWKQFDCRKLVNEAVSKGLDAPPETPLAVFQTAYGEFGTAVTFLHHAQEARVFSIAKEAGGTEVTVELTAARPARPTVGTATAEGKTSAVAEKYSFSYHVATRELLTASVGVVATWGGGFRGATIGAFVGTHLCSAQRDPSAHFAPFWRRRWCESLGLGAGLPVTSATSLLANGTVPDRLFTGATFWPLPPVSVSAGPAFLHGLNSSPSSSASASVGGVSASVSGCGDATAAVTGTTATASLNATCPGKTWSVGFYAGLTIDIPSLWALVTSSQKALPK